MIIRRFGICDTHVWSYTDIKCSHCKFINIQNLKNKACQNEFQKVQQGLRSAKTKFKLKVSARQTAMPCQTVSIESIDLWEDKWRQNGGRRRKGFVGAVEFLTNDLGV